MLLLLKNIYIRLYTHFSRFLSSQLWFPPQEGTVSNKKKNMPELPQTDKWNNAKIKRKVHRAKVSLAHKGFLTLTLYIYTVIYLDCILFPIYVEIQEMLILKLLSVIAEQKSLMYYYVCIIKK